MHDRQFGRAGIAEHLGDAFVAQHARKASRPVMVLDTRASGMVLSLVFSFPPPSYGGGREGEDQQS